MDRREATEEILAYVRLTKKGLNGVNSQLPNGLRFNLSPSKRQFLPSTVKMQKSDPSKSFKVFKISPFQLIFTDLWFLKNINTGKTSSHVVKNTLSRHYKTLQFAYFDISKFFK